MPLVALYAPLLAVESEPARRERIEQTIAGEGVVAGDVGPERAPGPEAKALRGVAADGTHACVIVAPLYLDFVQVLQCRYTPAGGFVAVRHEPLRHAGDARASCARSTACPSSRRRCASWWRSWRTPSSPTSASSSTTPAALASFAHLFGPSLEDDDGAGPHV